MCFLLTAIILLPNVRGMSMFVTSSPKNMEGVGPLPTLVAYTCGGKVAKGHTNTLVACTCGGQYSKEHDYMSVACTCYGQMCVCLYICPDVFALKCLRHVPKHWKHTPAMSKCLRDVPSCRLYTPAMGKCLRDVPKACRIYLWGANV